MTDPTAHYLLAEQLRPGVYVLLELPWFAHNFTLNSFKIRSEKQVQELRALGLTRYRYDPARSDLPEALQTPLHAADQGTPQASAPNSQTPTAEEDPAEQARREHLQTLSAWRDRLADVERAFGKATAAMKDLNRNLIARPKETLHDIGSLIGNMLDAFLGNSDATLHVMGDKVGGEEVYFHSLNVTILSVMIARDLGFEPDGISDLALGAMLHDIGLIDIPGQVLNKDPDNYNKAERNLRAEHVNYGWTLGRKIGLPPQALSVIAQHHEMVDGSGYPKACLGDAMTPAARVVAAVNAYDNLCNPLDVRKAMTPHEALSFLYSKRRDQFDHQVLQLMVRSLGVYPPGSVVQLSNGALAMVTSVNALKPTRPWVLVYDPQVPKEDAITIDLQTTAQVSITKSISPALLTPQQAAYLNPRKRVAYYFDGGDKAARRIG